MDTHVLATSCRIVNFGMVCSRPYASIRTSGRLCGVILREMTNMKLMVVQRDCPPTTRITMMQAFFFHSVLSALIARFLDSKIETLGEQLYFLDLNSGLITFCCGWLTPVYFLVESKFCYLQLFCICYLQLLRNALYLVVSSSITPISMF